MKKKEIFSGDLFLNIFLLSLLLCMSIFIIGFPILLLYDYYIDNKNNIESECFDFYKENNYVLNQCSDFEDKLKGIKNND